MKGAVPAERGNRPRRAPAGAAPVSAYGTGLPSCVLTLLVRGS